ncbi:hypothetical protein [Photobacterium kishitanii]|uniref:Uncharacterized protein n=1 Tax=Photobacterium kishitanii TaxID=318456 RepID=A0A2T3KLM6_9GAMM|nr:hypothetical protein [Photobacterium kishitanii]PSV00550.1 hypothetical protein C9J27_05290 [Photobacterium kishitanii]
MTIIQEPMNSKYLDQDTVSKYEITSSDPILDSVAKVSDLLRYISKTYGVVNPKNDSKHQQISSLIDVDGALEHYKLSDKSDYLKAISHAFYMSNIHIRWTDLFVVNKDPMTTLDSQFPLVESAKKIVQRNNLIMTEYFRRIFIGMSDADREELLCGSTLPVSCDSLNSMTHGLDQEIYEFDKNMNAIFLHFQRKYGNLEDHEELPDSGVAESLEECEKLFGRIFPVSNTKGYQKDSLRLTLLKNQIITNAEKAASSHIYLGGVALKNIPEIMYEQNGIASLEYDDLVDDAVASEFIDGLFCPFGLNMKDNSEEVLEIYNVARYLLDLYIVMNRPTIVTKEEYRSHHDRPWGLAIFIILLLGDKKSGRKIKVSSYGESNTTISAFINITTAVNNVFSLIESNKEKGIDTLFVDGVGVLRETAPETLLYDYSKRYALCAIGTSECFPLKTGVKCQSNVNRTKWVMLETMYSQMKSMSLSEIKDSFKKLSEFVEKNL